MVEFLNPLGLWSLSGLVLLTIFYLFMHRPKKLEFPSIMFFMKEDQLKKTNAFFQKLLVNLLFFVQLLILALIGLSIANPILESSTNTTAEHIILVIDASASMQASDRFSEAITQAKEVAADKSKVSIILAQSLPLTILDKGTSQRAIDALNELTPADMPATLSDAMLQAIGLGEGTIYVFSDFQTKSSEDILAAQTQLRSAGYGVQFKAVAKPANNIGFVDGEVINGQARLKIKNFMQQSTNFKITGSAEQEVTLTPNGLTTLSFPLVAGENTFEIQAIDQMPADNKAYFYQASSGKIKTLVITNSDQKGFAQTALESIPILEVTTAKLPNVPQEQYDLYVIDRIDPNRVLPTTFEELYRKAKDGSRVVVMMQGDSLGINYEKLQLFSLETKEEAAVAIPLYQNEVTSGVEFGGLSRYYTTGTQDCTPWVVTTNNNTVICHRVLEEGSILQVAILEDTSFKSRPDYPIFWNNLINYYFGEQDTQSKKTGELIAMPTNRVSTPYGNVVTNKLILDVAGYYTIDNETFSANLFDVDESNVNTVINLEEAISTSSSQATAKSKTNLAKPFMLVALLFLIIELIITKRRGEL